MMKKVQEPARPTAEKVGPVSRRSAVMAALSLLSASMGLVLNDAAKGEITQDVTVNKAKTADKAYNQMDNYVRGRMKQPSKGPTVPPKTGGGRSHK